ncbi:hypothetical protein JW824_14475 [bacterium]|nr:hypothetical protein [bacterium]
MTLFLIAPFSIAQSTHLVTKVLHESIGEVIDAEENIAYNFFGDIPGFTAARIYKISKDKFLSHILPNIEERAQILILDLPCKKILAVTQQLINLDRCTPSGEYTI